MTAMMATSRINSRRLRFSEGERSIGLNDTVEIERPTPPDTYPPIAAPQGKVGAVATGLTGLVVGGALGAVQLPEDLRLAPGQRLCDRPELLGERRVFGLGREGLGPVHGEIETAAPVVYLVDLAGRKPPVFEIHGDGLIESLREDLGFFIVGVIGDHFEGRNQGAVFT